MKNLREINWFRLAVVVGLSLATSLSQFFGDEVLSRGEIFNTILQATIVGFSFLQCPEVGKANGRKKDAEKQNGSES